MMCTKGEFGHMHGVSIARHGTLTDRGASILGSEPLIARERLPADSASQRGLQQHRLTAVSVGGASVAELGASGRGERWHVHSVAKPIMEAPPEPSCHRPPCNRVGEMHGAIVRTRAAHMFIHTSKSLCSGCGTRTLVNNSA